MGCTKAIFMKGFVFACVALVLMISCNTKKKPVEDVHLEQKVAILQTDRDFSERSKEKGLRSAYMEFMDEDAVLLRPNKMPLEGGQALDLVVQSDDSASVLSWEPKNVAIAASGDMGYTYGVYARKPSDEDTVYYGTYVTIWKKMPDGKWKFVLQSGNEGIDISKEGLGE